MTLYGWDCSHYDGSLSSATLARARVEGIVFLTHKVGEGLANDDPLDATVLAAAREVGIEFLGGYYVIHQGIDPVKEADRCIALADQDEPWWRTYPGWFWQCDAERWSLTDRATLSEIRAFCDRLTTRTSRLVVCYASRGQYGDDLTGLDYPLWNAAYPTSIAGPFETLYPSDGSRHWAPYSGQTPVFWQYTSSATIAGVTTCDANAYRGTLSDLRTLIEGGGQDMAFGPAEEYVLHVMNYRLEGIESNRTTIHIPAKTTSDGVAHPAKDETNQLAAALAAITSAVTTPAPPASTDLTRTVLADAYRAATQALDPTP
jgi:GH25 family lysozyme M1 (1,4-beta-N-acetylmuramidase)